jgi:PTS system nitrogen regulatory IIA component
LDSLQDLAAPQVPGVISLAEIFAPERVCCDADATSKKKALEKLSELLSSAQGTPNSRVVADRLLAREKLGSTALGFGVAIPHGRCADVSTAVAAFLKLDDGVDFEAADGEPVDLVVGLLVPEECTDGHLQLLAQLAELFSQSEVRDRLRGHISSTDLLQIISQSAHTL